MSRKSTSAFAVLRSALVAGLLLLSPALAAASFVGDVCGAAPVDLDSSLRVLINEPGAPFDFTLDLPAAGILSLDVTASAAAPADPHLGLATECARPAPGFEPTVIGRSAGHLVISVTAPGIHHFRVATPDLRRPLGAFRLRAAFSPFASPTRFAKDGEDEEEIEIEANPFRHGGLQGESRPLAVRLAELCLAGEADDHGDSFPCATLLVPGRRSGGEIGNGWGDDQDVFAVVVGGAPAELWSLVVEAGGEIDLDLALYDRSGQRLAADGGGGPRLALTVAPGTYFVRVGGRHGAEGLYELRAAAAAW